MRVARPQPIPNAPMSPPTARLRRLASALLALAAVILLAALPRPARAFGDEGAFDPRVLLTGDRALRGRRGSTGARALVLGAGAADERARAPQPDLGARRRSRPRRRALRPTGAADSDVRPLTERELAGLRRFFALGGVLLVDDAARPGGETSASAAAPGASSQRVLPDGSPIAIGPDHVLFRSFYLLRRADGPRRRPAVLEAIVRGGAAQVIFSAHDLGGRARSRERRARGSSPSSAGRRPAARARHPPRGEHRDVRALLELQGRPGPRALPDAPPRAEVPP